MIYGSVCSGIEAATVAWHPLGWKPAFFCENDAFPSAVLAHHYPDVPNFGDMTKFKEWPDAAIDVLVGGCPCQSFSIAGLRKGMADPRGNLTLVYLGIIDRYRPKWVVYENVPGILSSNEGRDFGSFLGGLAELGYGFAYRVLDAQFVRIHGFGRAVPQRRRRVFVVGYLGDWRRAAAVLFERESMLGNPPPRRQAGQVPAPTHSARTKGGGGLGTDFDCDGGLVAKAQAIPLNSLEGASHCLNGKGTASGYMDASVETFVAHSVDVAPTLRAGGNVTGGDRPYGTDVDTCDSLLAVPQGVALRGREGGATALEARAEVQAVCFSSKDHGADASVGVAPTLRAMGHAESHANAGGQLAIAFDETQITSKDNRCNPQPGDPSHPLAAGARPPTLAYRTTGNDGAYETGDVAACLNTNSDPAAITLLQFWRVRRLTPQECEKLQGFPPGYTAIPYRGKIAADGPRYKSLGNSMACNVMRWIGTRIELVEKIERKAA
jgi:DNA (cytosine-5)-methyltransferase 1